MTFTQHQAAARTELARAMNWLRREQRAEFAEWAALEFGGIFIPAQPPETPDAPAPPDARRTPAQITLMSISAEDFDTNIALAQWATAALRSAKEEAAA